MSDVLKRLKISDYIFGIFIVMSMLGFYANKKTRDKIYNLDNDGKKKAHYARLLILLIALGIYIYYLELKVDTRGKNKNKTFLDNLSVLAAFLFVIGGLIALYNEYKGQNDIIITD